MLCALTCSLQLMSRSHGLGTPTEAQLPGQAPDLGPASLSSGRGPWPWHLTLSNVHAVPRTLPCLQEHCDRGSLLSAIKRGIFRLEPEAAVEAAEATGPSSASSLRSTAHSSKEGWATTVAAAASGASGGRPGLTRIPEAAVEAGRFPRRVVLRAILRTARDIAQVC